MTRTHRIALLLAGSALIAGAQAASADVRISVGGGIRFGGGPIRAHWVHRHVHRPPVHVGGSIWNGGGSYYQPFAQPPPPPPPPMSCNCEQPQTKDYLTRRKDNSTRRKDYLPRHKEYSSRR